MGYREVLIQRVINSLRDLNVVQLIAIQSLMDAFYLQGVPKNDIIDSPKHHVNSAPVSVNIVGNQDKQVEVLEDLLDRHSPESIFKALANDEVVLEDEQELIVRQLPVDKPKDVIQEPVKPIVLNIKSEIPLPEAFRSGNMLKALGDYVGVAVIDSKQMEDLHSWVRGFTEQQILQAFQLARSRGSYNLKSVGHMLTQYFTAPNDQSVQNKDVMPQHDKFTFKKVTADYWQD
jgi:hypothetical protein